MRSDDQFGAYTEHLSKGTTKLEGKIVLLQNIEKTEVPEVRLGLSKDLDEKTGASLEKPKRFNEDRQYPVPDVEKLFEEHGNGLYCFALSRVGESTIAEDLVQETFLAALKSIGSYKGHSPVRSWLLGIMKHKIVDHFRKEGRLKEVKYEYGSEPEINEQFGMPCRAEGYSPKNWDHDPYKAHSNKKFLNIVEICLQKLTPKQKDVFVLKEIEEYKTSEIEGILGLTGNNIRVILFRARVLMRSHIEKNWLADNPTALH